MLTPLYNNEIFYVISRFSFIQHANWRLQICFRKQGNAKGYFFKSFIRKPRALGTHRCEPGAELRHFPGSSQPSRPIPGRRTARSACGTDCLTETRDFPPSRHTQNSTRESLIRSLTSVAYFLIMWFGTRSTQEEERISKSASRRKP